MEKKKLIITASTFPRWRNDTEPRFVLDLASHLTDDFDVTVLVPMAKGAKVEEEMEGIHVIRYHYFPIREWETLCYPGAIVPRIKEKKIRIFLVPFLFFSLYFNLKRLLPEFDIVHAHWLIPQGIVQSFFKKPYIVTGHGGDVTSLNKGIIKKLKVRCLKKAKYVTVVSDFLQDEVLQLCSLENIKVISMGCNLKKFGRKFYVKDYFGQEGKKVVLFVGRLAEKKGVTYLIEAMREIDAILVIVGEGPLKKELVNQARGMEDKVKFWGAKTHEELSIIYASSDIFVAPSITASDGDREGLGLVILEAMASGIPVVASDSGGIAGLISDGVNGLLCQERNVMELRKKIILLLENRMLYKKMQNNAKNIVEQFSYNILAKQYADLLDKGGEV